MRRIIMAMAAVLLFAAGCGDDSSGGGRFGTATDDSSAGGDTGDSEDAGDGGDDSSGGEDSGSASDGGGDGESAGSIGGDSEFCGLNADINDGLDGLNLFGGPDTVEEAFRQIADNIDRATSRAPAEIQDDVRILSDGVAGFIEVLEEYDFNFLAIPDDAVATDPRLAAIEDPAYEAAADRVNAYCGFDDESGATTDEPGTDVDGADVPDDPGAGAVPVDILIESFMAGFGWDEQTARCVVEEVGLDDPFNIDPTLFSDPTREVCGSTIGELFS